MLNLVRAQRVKKNQEGREKGEDEIISKEWANEDDDNFLIVRLLQGGGNQDESTDMSHPWILVHHGIHEEIRSPLVIFIEEADQKGASVSVTLRDHANRDENCIKRKFIFEFHSPTDAMIFKYAHNLMLKDHYQRLTEEGRICPIPSKKRKFDEVSSTIEDEGKDKKGDDKDLPQLDELEFTIGDEEKKIMIDRLNGDDKNLLDDRMLNTQDPFF
jgi:hypothetical protein